MDILTGFMLKSEDSKTASFNSFLLIFACLDFTVHVLVAHTCVLKGGNNHVVHT